LVAGTIELTIPPIGSAILACIQAPKPGDTLMLNGGGKSPNPAVVNIWGNDLAGDKLSIGNEQRFTGNLSHQAHATTDFYFGNGTFNVTQGSDLTVTAEHGWVTVNAQNSGVHIAPWYGSIGVTLSGVDTISAVANNGPGSPGAGHFHLNAGALAIGTIATGTSIDGDAGSRWMTQGTSTIYSYGDRVGVDVIGNGTIAITGKTLGNPQGPAYTPNMEFMQSVGANVCKRGKSPGGG
jgi:hypothetical protein